MSEPRILNVVHVNVNVTDIHRSLAFYRKLGFEVMHVFGDDLETGIELGGRHTRGVVLSLGDDPRSTTRIELLESLHPKAEPQPERPPQRAGVGRIALRTRNLRAMVERLRSEGVEFEGDPWEIDIVGARRFALLRDPDGTLLELIEF